MNEVRDIWETGIEIIFEQWKLLLDEAPVEYLSGIWEEIYDIEYEDAIYFEDWLEEQA